MWFDWSKLNAFLSVIALGISSAGVVYTWLTRGSRKNTQAIAELRTNLRHQENRLERVEARLDALPNREDLHQLDKKIEAMDARFEGFENTLKAVQRATERISDYLMNNPGGKA